MGILQSTARGGVLASIMRRIQNFLRSPQGRQARARAERLARDPRTRAKVQGVMRRFNKRH
jgi:hypothetical protein